MKVVILADDIGEKLWPVTSAEFPKALLPVQSQSPSLESTIERVILALDGLGEDIYIVLPEQSRKIIEAMSILDPWQIPQENIIYIPEHKGSVLSMSLVCMYLNHIHSIPDDEIVMFMPPDHFYDPPEGFLFHISNMLSHVKPGYDKLVLLGLEPAGPAAHLNYMEYKPETTRILGKEIAPPPGVPASQINTVLVDLVDYDVVPDEDTAADHLLGNWIWDLNTYVGSLGFFKGVLFDRLPEAIASSMLSCFERKWRWFKYKFILDKKTLKNTWAGFPNVGSFEIEVLPGVVRSKRAQSVIVSSLGWTLLDNWIAIKYLLYDSGLFQVEEQEKVNLVESAGTFVFKPPDKEVAIFGIEDLIVIDTGERLLIGTPKGLHEHF